MASPPGRIGASSPLFTSSPPPSSDPTPTEMELVVEDDSNTTISLPLPPIPTVQTGRIAPTFEFSSDPLNPSEFSAAFDRHPTSTTASTSNPRKRQPPNQPGP